LLNKLKFRGKNDMTSSFKDGELFVTDSIKDPLMIRGHNHYPQDIELTVEQSHPSLPTGCGAAFSVEVGGKERLVVVQEIEHDYQALDTNEVVRAIQQAVAQQHELQFYAVVLVKTGSIPKTSSGKIQRQACRASFLAGTLDLVGDWAENPQGKVKFLHLLSEVETLVQQLQTCKQQPSLSDRNNADGQASCNKEFQKAEAIQG
jgi:hypothetical protein